MPYQLCNYDIFFIYQYVDLKILLLYNETGPQTVLGTQFVLCKQSIYKNKRDLLTIIKRMKLSEAISQKFRISRPEVFLGKGVLKICSKFPGEQKCRSAISIKFQSIFIEITLPYGCSPVNLLHIFGASFLKNTSGQLLLKIALKNYIKVGNPVFTKASAKVTFCLQARLCRKSGQDFLE